MRNFGVLAVLAIASAPLTAATAGATTPAPTFTPVGPVISSTILSRQEYVQFGGAALGTPCISSPCTISSGSPAVTSVSRTAVGEYTVNFKAGTFSQPPTCTAIGGGDPMPAFAAIGAVPTTTSFSVEFATANGGTADEFVTVTCMGPYTTP